jgi:hypothetical protein
MTFLHSPEAQHKQMAISREDTILALMDQGKASPLWSSMGAAWLIEIATTPILRGQELTGRALLTVVARGFRRYSYWLQLGCTP